VRRVASAESARYEFAALVGEAAAASVHACAGALPAIGRGIERRRTAAVAAPPSVTPHADADSHAVADATAENVVLGESAPTSVTVQTPLKMLFASFTIPATVTDTPTTILWAPTVKMDAVAEFETSVIMYTGSSSRRMGAASDAPSTLLPVPRRWMTRLPLLKATGVPTAALTVKVMSDVIRADPLTTTSIDAVFDDVVDEQLAEFEHDAAREAPVDPS